MLALSRQGIDGRLTGKEDVNDAVRLRIDAAKRRMVAVSGRLSA